MAIIVEHEKRRKQILKKALVVFEEKGFEDATFQKIADNCKITRTTLYLYFRNKQEIFTYSIKQLMQDAERDILKVKEDAFLSSPDKIKKTISIIFARLVENKNLLSVILDYLITLSKNTDHRKTLKHESLPDTRVRRRTIRLRRILTSMIIEGIKKKQLKKIDVKAANEYFYAIIEAAFFRLVVLKRENVSELENAAELAVNAMAS